MSFVDLMASDVWTDADITRRTEAMVRSRFTEAAELVINRKLQGAALGQYRLTPAEQAEVAAFNATVFDARQAGEAARADMALLREVLAAEPAYLRLRRQTVAPALDEEGAVINQEALDADAAERAEAQAAMDSVSTPGLELLALRNPEPEPAAETTLEAEPMVEDGEEVAS